MRYIAALLAAVATATAWSAEPVVSYDGYKYIRVPLDSQRSLVDFSRVTQTLGVKILDERPMQGYADVAVSKELMEAFESRMAGIASLDNVIHEDMGKDIAAAEAAYEPYQGKIN